MLKSIFSLCSQASVDHLSAGLKPAPQTVLARRLLLRQLSATLWKGQMLFHRDGSLLSAFPLIADASLCRSVVQIGGGVLCPERGPAFHRDDDPLPACAQRQQRSIRVEWRNQPVSGAERLGSASNRNLYFQADAVLCVEGKWAEKPKSWEWDSWSGMPKENVRHFFMAIYCRLQFFCKTSSVWLFFWLFIKAANLPDLLVFVSIFAMCHVATGSIVKLPSNI